MLDFKLKRLPGGCEGASECIAAIPVCAAVLQLLQPGGRGRSPRFRAGGSILLRRGKRSCDVSSCERNDRSPIIFPYIYIYRPFPPFRRGDDWPSSNTLVVERGRWSILGISIDRVRRGFLSCLLIIREKGGGKWSMVASGRWNRDMDRCRIGEQMSVTTSFFFLEVEI